MDILNIIESRLLYHLIPPQTQVSSGIIYWSCLPIVSLCPFAKLKW